MEQPNALHKPIDSANREAYSATFIGTDFNYATNKEFRNNFVDEKEEDEGEKHNERDHMAESVRNDPEFREFARQCLRMNNSQFFMRYTRNFILQRKKNVCFAGMMLMFFIIASITTIVIGIASLISLIESGNFEMNFNVFNYTLPFISFLYDHSVKKIKNLGERPLFIFVKLMVLVYYLGIYVIALQS